MKTWICLLLVTLLPLGLHAELSERDQSPERAKHWQFGVNGVGYKVRAMECGNLPASSWDFNKSDVPPISFRTAAALMKAELNRAFPGEVFDAAEMTLEVTKKSAHYERRFTHLRNGKEYSYTHFYLTVDMAGNVSRIERAKPAPAARVILK